LLLHEISPKIADWRDRSEVLAVGVVAVKSAIFINRSDFGALNSIYLISNTPDENRRIGRISLKLSV
jgi:hypothetical protein